MSFSSLDMAKIPQGDNHFNVKDETDKGSNQWRQPVTPESPKAPLEFCEGQSETTSQQQQRSLCGVKDLSRLSRKRRTVQNGRLCSRRRNEEKDLGPNVDTKPRVSKIKGKLLRTCTFNIYSSFKKFGIVDQVAVLTSYLKAANSSVVLLAFPDISMM